MKKIVLALISLGTLLLMGGCSVITNKSLSYRGESAEYIYAKGHEQVKDGYYHKAIDTFRSLNSQYPFQICTEMGNLELIYSYYEDGQPEMALGLARQFLGVYPTCKYLGYVYYMMGVINYDNSRGFLQRRLPYDMAQHDPASYLQAFDDLNHAVALSPKASFVEDARCRMVHINNVVAEYEYNIANFYFKHQAYVAAINRAKIVVEQYPQSNSIENALVLLIRSYNSLKIEDLAQKSMEVLKVNYPNNVYIKSLEDVDNCPTVVFK